MVPAKCYCFNVAKINAGISLECVKISAARSRRGSVMVSTSACHAADPGSIPGLGMCHY